MIRGNQPHMIGIILIICIFKIFKFLCENQSGWLWFYLSPYVFNFIVILTFFLIKFFNIFNWKIKT